VDLVVLAGKVDYTVTDPGCFKEHVERQLALQVDVPLLAVRSVAVITTEGIDRVAITERRAEWCSHSCRYGIGIPRSWRGSKRTGAGAVELAGQQVAVVHSDLAGAVLVGAAIEEGYVETGLDHHLMAQLIGKAKTRPEVSKVDIGTSVAGAAVTVAELGSSSRYARNGVGTRVVRIEENNQVMLFSEGHLDIPANTKIHCQFRSQLDVILNVRSEIPVAQPFFLGVRAVRIIRKTQQETGKRAAVVREVGVACIVNRGLLLAEVELTALGLFFVVVLIRAAKLATDVEGMASLGPQPVVHQRYAQLAVDRT